MTEDDLLNMGFSRVMIFRLVKNGRRDERQQRMDKLAAFIREIQLSVEDVAAFFECRIVESAPITPVDLWCAGATDLIYALAQDLLAPADVLEEFEPGWRHIYASEWEVFDAPDGHKSIRRKEST